jgi:hypothetical protein
MNSLAARAEDRPAHPWSPSPQRGEGWGEGVPALRAAPSSALRAPSPRGEKGTPRHPAHRNDRRSDARVTVAQRPPEGSSRSISRSNEEELPRGRALGCVRWSMPWRSARRHPRSRPLFRAPSPRSRRSCPSTPARPLRPRAGRSIIPRSAAPDRIGGRAEMGFVRAISRAKPIGGEQAALGTPAPRGPRLRPTRGSITRLSGGCRRGVLTCFGRIDRCIGEPPCARRGRRTDPRSAAVFSCPAGEP